MLGEVLLISATSTTENMGVNGHNGLFRNGVLVRLRPERCRDCRFLMSTFVQDVRVPSEQYSKAFLCALFTNNHVDPATIGCESGIALDEVLRTR